MKSKIHILTTGGTIEKSYDERDGSLENRGPVAKEIITSYLKLPYTSLNYISVLCKDSLYMTDEDRDLLLSKVTDLLASSYPIVIFHGTDTMALTAKHLHDQVGQLLKKPVILTGAMKPIGFRDSDAIQNITEALILAKTLPAGVYVAFHNEVFPGDRVRKNISTKTFESCD